MRRDFKLQKVLEYRERLVEEERKKLSQMMSQEKDIKARLIQIDSEAKKNAGLMEKQQQEGQFAFVSLTHEFLQRLAGMKAQMNAMLKDVQRRIEVQRRTVTAKLNDKKAIEKLKERHVENWHEFVKKEEMKFIDELNMVRRNSDDI